MGEKRTMKNARILYLEGLDFHKGLRAGDIIQVSSKSTVNMDGDTTYYTTLKNKEKWPMLEDQLEFV